MMLAISMMGFASCTSENGTATRADDSDLPTEFQIQYTDPVPSAYFQEATEQGTVEVLWYDSKDYTRSDRPATHKPAYVYLPMATTRHRNTMSYTCCTAGRGWLKNTLWDAAETPRPTWYASSTTSSSGAIPSPS